MADDIFDELESRKSSGGSDDYAPWWDPSEDGGEQLVGIVFEKHVYDDDYGNSHNIWQVRSAGRGDYDEGSEFATPTHSNIKRLLQGASIGDLVLIENQGLQQMEDSPNSAYQYSVSIIPQSEWRGSDQADELEEVAHTGVGLQSDKTPQGDGSSSGDSGNNNSTGSSSSGGNSESTSSSESSSDGDAGMDDEAIEFTHDVMDMNDGETELEELDDMLNTVRNFEVDPAEAAEEAGYEVDGETVKKAG